MKGSGRMASNAHDFIKEFNAVERVRHWPVAHPQDARSTHPLSLSLSLVLSLCWGWLLELGGFLIWSCKITRIWTWLGLRFSARVGLFSFLQNFRKNSLRFEGFKQIIIRWHCKAFLPPRGAVGRLFSSSFMVLLQVRWFRTSRTKLKLGFCLLACLPTKTSHEYTFLSTSNLPSLNNFWA